jgi:hypothetical protein
VSSVAEALDRWRAGERVQTLSSQLLDVLASVPDPRHRRGRRYPLAGLSAVWWRYSPTAPRLVLGQLAVAEKSNEIVCRGDGEGSRCVGR